MDLKGLLEGTEQRYSVTTNLPKAMSIKNSDREAPSS